MGSNFALRFRLLVVVLLAFLPPLGLLLGQAASERRAALEAFRREMLLVTRTAAHQGDLVAEAARQFLGRLAHLPTLRGSDRQACSALLSQRLREHPLYAEIAVLDRDGKPRCAARQPEIGGLDRLVLPEVLRAQRFVAGRFGGPRVRRSVVLFGHPVVDARGRPGEQSWRR